ncbi:HEPN domain-containing protein [Candidatus Galacturonibacter soehngenii]|uniref:Apea-like HEPN domain-containing protein n=1 Tax=Candidatus Galacturonatibacter soehngenii TaxID=2307010 RepID=A0A7V7UFJ5_9FIRM|nr:HEPN domain-containing protein [Candidatus Galacturonibacter soehngenii]KAB1437546.1 hypothetical protein F7O84_08025 [Candidatus Galacturonibacter soehngenii]
MNKESVALEFNILKESITVKKRTEFVDDDNIIFERTKDNYRIYIDDNHKYESYKNSLNKLFLWITNKTPEVTIDYAEDVILDLIIEDSDIDILKLENYFLKLPIINFTFLRPLYGLSFYNENIIDKGKYKFISASYIKEYLLGFIPDNPMKEHWINRFLENEKRGICYVETHVATREPAKAEELADKNFKQLDNVLRYMMGDRTSYKKLGVFNYQDESMNFSILKGNNDFLQYNHNNPFRYGYNKLDSYFFDYKNGNGVIWDLLNKENKTEIQKRVLRGLEWVGMSINEKDVNMAFIQCFFAIECILQDQQGFITKSISAQISEYVAFILGDNLEARIEIENRFKKLYDVRSKIAHGNQTDEAKINMDEIIEISKLIIINLLTKDDLKVINSISELRNYITHKRYG